MTLIGLPLAQRDGVLGNWFALNAHPLPFHIQAQEAQQTACAPFFLFMEASTAVLALITITGSPRQNRHRRHAYAFVAHRSDFVGGNFTVNRRLPFKLLSQQDKAFCPTAEAIKQQAAQGTRTEHAFTGNASDKWDNAMENKDAVLFGNELSGAYLDGYLGVK